MLIPNMAGDAHLHVKALVLANAQVVREVAMAHVWAVAKGIIN